MDGIALQMPGRIDETTEEPQALERARSGDAAAFEILYRRHVGRVYALCLRMTANTAQAEDLTQEVFVRAWQKLDSFRGDSAFGTWLHRLTVNLVLTSLRSASRYRARVVSTDNLESFGHQERAAAPGLRADLEHAIAALPKGARTVFVLHDVEGYRHHEIAAMTGLATGTSKAQLHRARKLLREALA